MQPGDPHPGPEPYGQPQYNQPGYGQMPSFPDPFAPPPQQSPAPPPAPQPLPVPHSVPPPQIVPEYDVPLRPSAYPPGGAPPPAQTDGTAVLALIFGIASIPFAVCCGLLGVAAGVGGIVLGLAAVRKADDGLAPLAIAGAICGAAGVLLAILVFLVGGAVAGLPY